MKNVLNIFKKSKHSIPDDEVGLIWITKTTSGKKEYYGSYEEMCQKTTLDLKTTRNKLGSWVVAKNKVSYFVDLE